LGEAHELIGMLLLEAGRLAEGIARLEVAQRMCPELRLGVWERIRCHELLGDHGRARRLMQEARQSSGGPRDTLIHEVRFHGWRRATEGWDRLRSEALAWQPRDAQEEEVRGIAFSLIAIYAGLVRAPHEARPLLTLLRAAAAEEGASPRRRVFCHQLDAELSLLLGDAKGGLTAVERMGSLRLGEGLWLDHCPLLEPIRAEPRFQAVLGDAREHCDDLMDEIWAGGV
jgi:serine/threonine-protein kinase